MKDRHSSTDQSDFTRRDFLKSFASLGAGAVAGSFGLPVFSDAAVSDQVHAYGVPPVQLRDWSNLTRSVGLKMDFVNSGNDVGVLMRDVIASQMGNKVDVFVFSGGTQNILGPQGAYMVLDEKNPELKLWQRTADVWKRSPIVVGKDGKQYGIPVNNNADSFGYFASKIGVNPDGGEDVSWSKVFDDEKTRGRVGYSKAWNYAIGEAALYLNASGKAKIANPGDLTPAEAKTVVDFLVARKKAGQFRTLFGSYEEQVQLLSNRDVDLLNCWEPAVRDVNLKLGPNAVCYAYTKEGYNRWGHGAYVASQAKDRGNLANIYKLLNYFLGGEYRALQARDRGYSGPNMDLAVQYATEHNWSQQDVDSLKATQAKSDRKQKKPYVSTSAPTNADAVEEQWQRFLNA